MKLNIMVIYEALSRNYTLCFVTCVDTNFAYSRPRLYTPGDSLVAVSYTHLTLPTT